MKLLGSTKKDVDQDKDGDVPKLESVDVVSVHCNLVNNYYLLLYQKKTKKTICLLITIAPHSLAMFNITNTEFSSIEVWFTDQNSKQLKIKDNVNMPLIIG